MRIFDSSGGWSSKVNFVDENNVLVGYDTSASCCEHADWFLSHKESRYCYDFYDEWKEEKGSKNFDVSLYSFDTSYFKDGEDVKGALDGGGMVIFRLIAKEQPDLYLHIFNAHNGYYRHGFEAKIGEKIWKEGSL